MTELLYNTTLWLYLILIALSGWLAWVNHSRQKQKEEQKQLEEDTAELVESTVDRIEEIEGMLATMKDNLYRERK